MLLHKLLYNTDQAQALPIWLNCLVMQFTIPTTQGCLKWHSYIFPLLHGFEMALLSNIRKSGFVVLWNEESCALLGLLPLCYSGNSNDLSAQKFFITTKNAIDRLHPIKFLIRA